MKALEVKNLRKSYYSKGKEFKAVRGVSFDIKEGEIFGLLGPNGAGKSTTINIVSGILKKDAGTVKILGKNPETNHEFVRNNMNVASAYFSLSTALTVNQNLKVYANLFGVQNPQKRIDELLDKLELTKLKQKKTYLLSSGERTKLSLCKGLINNPKLLLLDECTVGLDPDIAEKTRQIIRNYQHEYKTSILFTSHYMYEVEELCNRIAFLDEGKIITIDTTDNIKNLIKEQTVEIEFLKAGSGLKTFLRDKGATVLFMKNNTVKFEITAKGDKLYRLINSLFQRGFKIKKMNIKRPTLDDIFIKLARK